MVPQQRNKSSLRVRITVLSEVVLELIHKTLPITMLVVGTFTIGYAVKNIEDSHERVLAYDELRAQHRNMVAECDARLVASQQMTSDQTGRIEEQTMLIKQLQGTLDEVHVTQQKNVRLSKVELSTLKRAATETQKAASVVTNGTDRDRQQINAAVREKIK